MNINMNPNSELHQSIVNVPNLVQVPDPLMKQAYQFQEAMMMYTCAIRSPYAGFSGWTGGSPSCASATLTSPPLLLGSDQFTDCVVSFWTCSASTPVHHICQTI